MPIGLFNEIDRALRLPIDWLEEEVVSPMDLTVQINCTFCHEPNLVRVNHQDYITYINDELHVQDAFPYLTPDERELFISGTCTTCWNAMFDYEQEEY
jgi:hypothetical protein